MIQLNRFWSIIFVGIYGGVTLLLRLYWETEYLYDKVWLSIVIGLVLLFILWVLIKIKFLNFDK